MQFDQRSGKDTGFYGFSFIKPLRVASNTTQDSLKIFVRAL